MDVDVVIVGAGAAGLAAAAELSSAHLRVTILEGRKHIGGRVFTEPLTSGYVELGAEFLHCEAASLKTLIKKSGQEPENLERRFIRLYDGHKVTQKTFEKSVQKVSEEAQKLKAPMSVAAFMKQLEPQHDPRELFLAKMFFEGFHAARLEHFSTASLTASEEGPAGLQRLPHGYRPLLETLRAESAAELLLNWRVGNISWRRGRVSVTRSDNHETLTATAAVITLPLPVLQNKTSAHVVFEPPLVEKKKALETLEMGPVVKLCLQFDTAFIEQSGFGKDFVLLQLDEKDPFHVFWWGPKESHSLVAWAGGGKAEKLAGHSFTLLRDLALKNLATGMQLDPEEVHKHFRGLYYHDWQADPLAGGAYSYGSLGAEQAFEELAKPMGDTLFFAGEATHPTKNGTVDGAIESGRRAARELLQSLPAK